MQKGASIYFAHCTSLYFASIAFTTIFMVFENFDCDGLYYMLNAMNPICICNHVVYSVSYTGKTIGIQFKLFGFVYAFWV